MYYICPPSLIPRLSAMKAWVGEANAHSEVPPIGKEKCV